MQASDDMPHVMGDDGQFHAQDEAVDLSGTPIEAWVALGIFWLLGITVFYQFFTRYVLNDSASWTEEIARYLLIATVFTGATIGVVKNNHIQVDFFYRYMPQAVARGLATLVDVLRIAFFAAAVVLTVDDDAQARQQLPHDHGRSADELGLRRVPAGLCRDGVALGAGGA